MIPNLVSLISVIKVLISAIVAFITAWLTVKFNLVRERNKGKILIFEIVKKYFILFYNSFEKGKESSTIKKDRISKEKYLRVIEKIENDFINLQNNLYYSCLLENYPSITMTQILISMEIAELRNREDFAFNAGTVKHFCKLFKAIKKDIPKKYLKNEVMKNFNHILEFIEKQNLC